MWKIDVYISQKNTPDEKTINGMITKVTKAASDARQRGDNFPAIGTVVVTRNNEQGCISKGVRALPWAIMTFRGGVTSYKSVQEIMGFLTQTLRNLSGGGLRRNNGAAVSTSHAEAYEARRPSARTAAEHREEDDPEGEHDKDEIQAKIAAFEQRRAMNIKQHKRNENVRFDDSMVDKVMSENPMYGQDNDGELNGEDMLSQYYATEWSATGNRNLTKLLKQPSGGMKRSYGR